MLGLNPFTIDESESGFQKITRTQIRGSLRPVFIKIIPLDMTAPKLSKLFKHYTSFPILSMTYNLSRFCM